jgi:hypothetical protein
MKICPKFLDEKLSINALAETEIHEMGTRLHMDNRSGHACSRSADDFSTMQTSTASAQNRTSLKNVNVGSML